MLSQRSERSFDSGGSSLTCSSDEQFDSPQLVWAISGHCGHCWLASFLTFQGALHHPNLKCRAKVYIARTQEKSGKHCRKVFFCRTDCHKVEFLVEKIDHPR
jgi:hypothetical protein